MGLFSLNKDCNLLSNIGEKEVFFVLTKGEEEKERTADLILFHCTCYYMMVQNECNYIQALRRAKEI